MKVLVTGHDGYIGTVLVPMFRKAGHEVVGLDSMLFNDCVFGEDNPPPPARKIDIRDVQGKDLEGFDAVIHLAGISNDPLGDLNPDCTYEINHRASVHLAKLAKDAGVKRFLFSSSCSTYGAGGMDDILDESAAFRPVTPYGESKVKVEEDLDKLADDDFSPTYLRNATAFGVSPRLRGDLVVNNLVAYALTTGHVLLKSDGTPWRPLVHIEDISLAFLAAMEAPRDKVHNQAFNVARDDQNFQIRQVAEMVEEIVPNCKIEYADGAGPDKRCYRVTCAKINKTLPEFKPKWTVLDGIKDLYESYVRVGLKVEDFTGARYLRIKHIKNLIAEGKLDDNLRWKSTKCACSAAEA